MTATSRLRESGDESPHSIVGGTAGQFGLSDYWRALQSLSFMKIERWVAIKVALIALFTLWAIAQTVDSVMAANGWGMILTIGVAALAVFQLGVCFFTT